MKTVFPLRVTSFYKFKDFDLGWLNERQKALEDLAQRLSIRGLIILGNEGINGTLSGRPEAVTDFKNELLTLLSIGEIVFKDSPAARHPFRKFKIQFRKEIVTLGKPEFVPQSDNVNHLPPDDWHAQP